MENQKKIEQIDPKRFSFAERRTIIYLLAWNKIDGIGYCYANSKRFDAMNSLVKKGFVQLIDVKNNLASFSLKPEYKRLTKHEFLKLTTV